MHTDPLGYRRMRRLARLVDLYAQTRALPLIFPLAILVLNVALILGFGPLTEWLAPTLWGGIALVSLLGVVVLANTVLSGYLVIRYGPRFYTRDGAVEVTPYYGRAWAWLLFAITFVGPAVLEPEHLAVPTALVICLCSAGLFTIYLTRKDERVTGLCLGGLVLAAALAFALGAPLPWTGEPGFFLCLMGTLVTAEAVTILIVHVFNRLVLRRIQRMRIGDARKGTADPGD